MDTSAAAVEWLRSMLMFSTLAPVMTLVAHHAPGVSLELQLDMYRPGEIVTVYGPLPLTAVTSTVCSSPRCVR